MKKIVEFTLFLIACPVAIGLLVVHIAKWIRDDIMEWLYEE